MKTIENLSIYSTFVFIFLSFVALAFEGILPLSIPIGILSAVLITASLVWQFADKRKKSKLMGVQR